MVRSGDFELRLHDFTRGALLPERVESASGASWVEGCPGNEFGVVLRVHRPRGRTMCETEVDGQPLPVWTSADTDASIPIGPWETGAKKVVNAPGGRARITSLKFVDVGGARDEQTGAIAGGEGADAAGRIVAKWYEGLPVAARAAPAAPPAWSTPRVGAAGGDDKKGASKVRTAAGERTSTAHTSSEYVKGRLLGAVELRYACSFGLAVRGMADAAGRTTREDQWAMPKRRKRSHDAAM
jgi:hypothetical protein